MIEIYNKNNDLIKTITEEEYKKIEKEVSNNKLIYIYELFNVFKFIFRMINKFLFITPIVYFWTILFVYTIDNGITTEIALSYEILYLVFTISFLSIGMNILFYEEFILSEHTKGIMKKLKINEEYILIKRRIKS